MLLACLPPYTGTAPARLLLPCLLLVVPVYSLLCMKARKIIPLHRNSLLTNIQRTKLVTVAGLSANAIAREQSIESLSSPLPIWSYAKESIILKLQLNIKKIDYISSKFKWLFNQRRLVNNRLNLFPPLSYLILCKRNDYLELQLEHHKDWLFSVSSNRYSIDAGSWKIDWISFLPLLIWCYAKGSII